MNANQPSGRRVELLLLILASLVGVLGLALAAMARQVQRGQPPLEGLAAELAPALAAGLIFAGLHVLLRLRRSRSDTLLLPLVALIFSLGLIMIWRLRGADGAWQQMLRGFVPGALLAAALAAWPTLVERVRRWTIPIAGLGLFLAFLTAVFGVTDESGARLALKLGPLPAIQTSEIIKVALILFLAWFVDREGEEVEGRARVLFGFLRAPALRYFIPGLLFVTMATLALVVMSDFGAVLILALIFVLMLYAGFETRVFATIAAIGLGLSVLVGVVLALTWELPAHIQYRYLAFLDPWSQEVMANGITIADGPGYQIQQAIYAIIAGGLAGRGLSYGTPTFIPLAATDFIIAAVLEEMGAMIGFALLAAYGIMIVRLLRAAALLPRILVFERLLLVGIAIHFFTQVLIMVGGTLNAFPLTGVTLPFLSLGGAALLINWIEIGLALAVTMRMEG